MNLSRRSVLRIASVAAGGGVLAGCTSSGNVDSETFPQQSIQIIIPFGPGGGYDVYSRTISSYLPEYLPNDVDIINTNMEGASGQIATVEVYQADPDGYTNMIVNEDLVMQQLLEEDSDYDLSRMTYYANLAIDTAGIAVSEATGIETFDGYVDAIREEELRFALTGVTSAVGPAVLGELSGLYSSANVLDNVVIYGSRGEAIQGVMAGDAEAIAGSFYSVLPFVQDNDLTMIVEISTAEEPPEQTPDAETLTTASLDNSQDIMDLTIDGRSFAGPPEIENDVTTTMRDAFEAAAHDADFLAEMDALGRPVTYAGGVETQESIENRFDLWERNGNLLERIYG